MMNEQQPELWAVVDLMGHGQTAGKIYKPGDWGGLIAIDVPEGDGFVTEMYGLSAFYKIKFVSEEIARACALRPRQIEVLNTPIITREQHQAAMSRLEERNYNLQHQVEELQRRLTYVRALPAPAEDTQQPTLPTPEGTGEDWDYEDRDVRP